MLSRVAVRGSGVGALCCASLLARRGVAVDLCPAAGDRPTLPAVVIGAETAALLREIFDEELSFGASHALQARVVDWSSGNAPVKVEEPGLVCSEAELLTAMRGVLERRFPSGVERGKTAASSLTIIAGGRAPAKSYRFGRRRAWWQVRPWPEEEAGVSRMAADAGGWTYHAPLDSHQAMEQRVAIAGPGGRPCAPRIAWPPTGPGWFACGAAALALDPVCGDGVGYAARSAIWLCALLTAHGGEGLAQAQTEYRTRLALAFRSHLSACLRLYSSARFAAAWEAELRVTERGLAAMDKLLRELPRLRSRLLGFESVAREDSVSGG